MAIAAVTDNGDTTDVPDSSKVPCSNNNHTNNTVSKKMYCVCNGPDDGRTVVLWEN